MGKKKNKISKISEEEYLRYIAGLKGDAISAPPQALKSPNEFNSDENGENGK